METASKRLITAEDLYDLNQITGCHISPDGKHIVYALQTVDRESEKKFNHLWRIHTGGGKPVQLTYGKHSDSSPQWSPDGQWIAFQSNRLDSKQSQLFLLPAAGGEAFPITDIKGDLDDFAWAPDSQSLVFQFRKHDSEDIEMREDDHKKELGRVFRRVTDRVFYKLDGYGYLPDDRQHLYLVNIQTKEVVQLTDSKKHDEYGPTWSPDGNNIAYFSNLSEQPDLNPDEIQLCVMDVATRKVTVVETPVGRKALASFSPSGESIAYVGAEGLNVDYKNNEIWVVDLARSGSARSLTAAYDFDVCGGVINDIGSVIAVPPVWKKDGSGFFFQVGRHGRTSLHTIDLEGHHLEELLLFDGVVASFSLDDDQDQIAFVKGTMTDPGQVATLNLENQAVKTLTSINQELLNQLDLGTYEEIWFTGADNNPLQGWVIKPPDFDPGKKYPSIMEIHGGPLAQYGFFFMHEFFYLAAQGYIIYFCNPRGGQGYGEDHTKAIYHGKWGTVDYDDLIVWADYMQGQPYIDPHNMGVTGGSYGGYMTVWIIGHTDRFKAAVAQRSVTNLLSMWGSSDFNWSFQMIFGDTAPYENMDTLWECSPIKHIGSAVTPTLIIHSMEDLRCAIEQSEQVYVALKKLGVDTEFLMFPDSPHGVSRTGRTDRRIVRLKAISDWFDRYLDKPL